MKIKKHLTTAAKIVVTVGLLVLVFRKIEFRQIAETLQESTPGYLLVALCCFVGSQWVSATRLLHFFHVHDYRLRASSNNILYLIGMFYNFFIPGGVGGDAYKVYVLHKSFNWNAKDLGFAILNDRISGLFAIGILAQGLAFFLLPAPYHYGIFISIPLSLLACFYFQKLVFKKYLPIFGKTLLLSVLVQGLQVLCVYFILKSFAYTDNFLIYGIVFLISSVLSILSFSGIGLREWFFMQAAEMYHFQSDKAVTVALIFSALTVVVSFVGIFFTLHTKKWLKTSV